MGGVVGEHAVQRRRRGVDVAAMEVGEHGAQAVGQGDEPRHVARRGAGRPTAGRWPGCRAIAGSGSVGGDGPAVGAPERPAR